MRVEQPIYRPIQPVVIEPVANVFTDTTTVTLTCATPGVEIRYTLDGSRPGAAVAAVHRALSAWTGPAGSRPAPFAGA